MKGLRVVLEGKGGSGGRKDSVAVAEGRKGDGGERKGKGDAGDKKRMVTGARIEFASEGEKRAFLELVRGVQREMRDLPALAGVN